MTKELTPWFPGKVKPARIGVYQRGSDSTTYYAKWDGKQWLSSCWASANAAENRIQVPSCNQHGLAWRGLATPPAH